MDGNAEDNVIEGVDGCSASKGDRALSVALGSASSLGGVSGGVVSGDAIGVKRGDKLK